jgi:hypothetical protein
MGAFAWIPGLIGAVVSVGLTRSSLLGFLFLLPLGVVAYCFNPKTAWFAALAAILGNLGLSLPDIGVDIFYLAVVIVVFTWITSPPAGALGFFRIPTVYRLLTGSVLTAVALGLVIYSMREDWGLLSAFREQAEAIASLYRASSGADVVQRSLTERYMTTDSILETLWSVALRGGMLASCVLLFFVSRQISLVITWVIRRKRHKSMLSSFHVLPQCIWVLSFSLLVILAGVGLKLAPLEIAGWNILVICAILYLVQGGGIAVFLLTQASIPPGVRFVLNLVILVVILSPGINAILLGVLILLGIAENWVPFRAPKTNGSSPTPWV